MRYATYLLAFILLISAVAGTDEGDTFDLVLSDNYCNCDADCEDMQGCLTNTTENPLFTITSAARRVIEEANEEGFNGVCVTLYFNDAIMASTMTEDCSSQLPQEPEEEEETEEEPEEEEEVEEEAEEEVIEEEPELAEEVVSVIEQVSENSNITHQEEGNGGKNMTLTTATIIAATVIVVGFFGLMAWMAFLLQKKSR